MNANRSPSYLRTIGAALIVILLQTGLVGYMIASRAAILRSGTEILLRTAPVDPRDLLRGDYVILNYDISTIPFDKIVGSRPEKIESQRLWVRLTQQPDGFWGVDEASLQELSAQPDSVIVIGTLPSYGASFGGSVNVAYGIERFYVPEGEGRDLELARGTEKLAVAAKVAESGQAQIRALLLDGKPVYDEPPY